MVINLEKLVNDLKQIIREGVEGAVKNTWSLLHDQNKK